MDAIAANISTKLAVTAGCAAATQRPSFAHATIARDHALASRDVS